jgi:hypothetical protein
LVLAPRLRVLNRLAMNAE